MTVDPLEAAAGHRAGVRQQPAIAAHDVAKSYGAVHALGGASFEARFGEVHAIVGENGAGKSTLIKILCGVTQPDRGHVEIDGQQVALASPADARQHGVSTVFQELTLMASMTVAENLFLTSPPRGRLGLIKRSVLVPRARDLLETYGLTHIDARLLASQLSVADQQLLEIVRALQERPRILFLDEPTAALAESDVEWLFAQVARLRDEGTCVLFTSHRWREVTRLADRITVFRDGEHIATQERLEEDEAVRLMTGRQVDRVYPDVRSRAVGGKAVLELDSLSGAGLHDVTLTVRAGEVLGIGGLAGQGQRQLFQTVFGATPARSGRILLDGVEHRIRKPADAISAGLGIAFVPEDRKAEGLLLPRSVRDNLSLAVLDDVSRAGVIRPSLENRLVSTMVDSLKIKIRHPSIDVVGGLSGGHQQKVLLGRWLLADPQVLLLYDVTRGVDVATKHEIYELIAELAERGKAVVMFSSETEEMSNLCHRVVVLHEGRIRAELTGDDVTSENIVAASLRENRTGSA